MTLPGPALLYRLVGDDDEARACREIPDEACADVPRSFGLNVLNGACTKLAEQLASPGLVLPWMLSSLGAPAAASAWLVPAKEAGSLAPQLAVAGWIRRQARRKWFWVAAGLVQAATLAAMAAAAVRLETTPAAAGIVVVVLLVTFSVASGVGSVAFSDVVGKTVPRGRRGRMLALRATLGGTLAVAAGVTIRARFDDDTSIGSFVVLLVLAAALWAAGAAFFALIDEPAGATGGGANGLRGALDNLHSLGDPRLRRFLAVRWLLLSVELSMPYFTLHARRLEDVGAADLGVFVVAVSLAAALSSPVWGRLADVASQRVIAAAGLVAAAAVTVALVAEGTMTAVPAGLRYAPAFLLLGLGQGGVRLGRKTYLVDMAPSDQKGVYKALASTLTGLVVLGAGALGLGIERLGVRAILAGLGVLMAAGAAAAWWLPEID